MNTVKVGIVGCGMISSRYVQGMNKFEVIEIVACADLDMNLAKQRALEAGPSARACSMDELLGDKSIELIVNLTTPRSHAPVSLAAIKAGKHVYSEKPLGVTRQEGKKIIDAAKKKGVRVGCAPDTFLGAGLQTSRRMVEIGSIGQVVGATAFCQGGGPEGYHPNPFFLFQKGGGPLFDMGPYYLTALIQLFGPIQRVVGFASKSRAERTVKTAGSPFLGQTIHVEIQDHVAGLLEFEAGLTATLVVSWANPITPHPPITVFGTEGALIVPDPNGFDGAVKIRKQSSGADWQDVPFTHPTGYSRGAGIADLAHAIRSGRPHRASGEQAMAVLDAITGMLDSSQSERVYTIKTAHDRPAPLPSNLPAGRLDD
ncbi:MAG: Gfo/Idh/MocA family oxidoreductase [Phycisphaeraceae bacterium]|nr:Gfo/Idh/MocA family oxidoreductase [Phycisphaeraceae bacterium]